jgi:uncharacterized membrane protein YdbT with pleckstrin-like domain
LKDIEIRPTVKFVQAGAILLGCLAILGWSVYLFADGLPMWVPLFLTALLFWPLVRWMKLRSIVSVLSSDRLRSQSGVLGRSSHTLQLSKIQDVGVSQSLRQRILNVGNVWIETSGASSRILLANIDNPQAIADLILDGSQQVTRR